MDLAEELRAVLHSGGADIVGFADLQEIDSEPRDSFPYGISIAVGLNPEIISGITAGPTKEYVDECRRSDTLLNNLGLSAVEFLLDKGFNAKQQATTNIDGTGYPPNLSTPLPHKTVATRAGLGWIGKTPLLVTKEYGSAIRLTTVLTDAPLASGKPINESNCGNCKECVIACPAQAITGEEWHAGICRESLLDAYLCKDIARQRLIERTGSAITGRTFCGMCIAACPWTQRYVSASARDA